jgi:hypothetical protein
VDSVTVCLCRLLFAEPKRGGYHMTWWNSMVPKVVMSIAQLHKAYRR